MTDKTHANVVLIIPSPVEPMICSIDLTRPDEHSVGPDTTEADAAAGAPWRVVESVSRAEVEFAAARPAAAAYDPVFTAAGAHGV